MSVASIPSVSSPSKLRRVALAGNPNAGKTTLFNALTGLRQRVGNYPGVTVEKKEGRTRLGSGLEASILDLPGTYSLSPKSPDEEIARDVLLGLRADTPPPDVVVVFVDASNLARNLYLATQVMELGIPTVIALNMIDMAQKDGIAIDAPALQRAIGAPVVEIVASKGIGLDKLREVLSNPVAEPQPPALTLSSSLGEARRSLALKVSESEGLHHPEGLALRLLCGNASAEAVGRAFGSPVAQMLEKLREGGSFKPGDETNARYDAIAPVVEACTHRNQVAVKNSFTD
ncbi:ferrous iron transport protein B, partial [bacterium]